MTAETRKRTTIAYYRLPVITGIFFTLFIGIWLSMQDHPAAKVQQNAREVKDQSGLLGGQWSYMPGATKEMDGSLHITNTGLAIVEQDGSGGQPNPPINLFGTHLEDVKDFRITAVLSRIQGKATLQLYGQPPIIADEFRIERQSVRLSVQGDTLYIDIWDGSGQQPVVSQTAKFEDATNKAEITIRDEAGKLYVSVGNKVVAAVPDHDIFSRGNVWFGADATQDWVLSDLQAEPIEGSRLTIADSSTLKVPDSKTSIQQLANARRPGFVVGAAMALVPAVTDPSYAQVAFGGNFGGMTTENALKWQFVHPEPNVYTFGEGDALIALAKRNNLAVHGHTLVFGEANPRWVQDLPTATQEQKDAVAEIMKAHIATVAGHYKGSVQSWDVVNEPLADYDNFDLDTGYILRHNKWFQAMGENYISEAFNTAHAADPTAKLFINEYGLEEDGERWDTFLALVKKLKSAGVPIHGVGFQAHVYNDGDQIPVSELRSHIRQLAKIGLVARISENDVYSYDGTDAQANQYVDVFNACFAEPNCIGYTTWGVSDRYDTYKDDDGNIAYGEDFLWSKDMEPTPAVVKLQSLLGQ